jgi:23S rRNA (cytosine1962-C5)-methyltransferase
MRETRNIRDLAGPAVNLRTTRRSYFAGTLRHVAPRVNKSLPHVNTHKRGRRGQDTADMEMAEAVVSRQAVESLRRGHPWIFRSNVGHVSANEPAIVSIVANGPGPRVPLGCGVWDPDSPIAIRVWATGAGVRLDANLFRERTAKAIALRRAMFADGRTTAYRLLNGEGDRVPGFVLDRYGDVAVLRIDGDAARAVAPMLTRDLESLLTAEGITTLLEKEGGRGEAKRIVERFGSARTKVEVREHGVPFVVDLARGQKTGAFLDQRENRARVGDLVRLRARAGLGTRVLNLFSYTGGFSLLAALGGATQVTSVDVAALAHATAQESFRLAGLDPNKHAFVAADAFAWLAEAARKKQQWDVVVSDPPSFAPNEKSKPKALAAYRSLHRACCDVLAPGGHLVAASCSSHVDAEDFVATLDDAALGRGELRLLELHGPPPDHPSLPSFPEGRYLKLAILG